MLCLKRVMIMKTTDHQGENKKVIIKKKKKENLSRSDWHDIMGIKRDTFKRSKGGAIKRR